MPSLRLVALACPSLPFLSVTCGSIFHPTVPTSAYPLAFPEAFASSVILPSQCMWLVTCSLHRPSERALPWLLRSDHPFCVSVRSTSIRRAKGVKSRTNRYPEPLCGRDHFGQSLLPRVGSLTVTTVQSVFASPPHGNLLSANPFL